MFMTKQTPQENHRSYYKTMSFGLLYNPVDRYEVSLKSEIFQNTNLVKIQKVWGAIVSKNHDRLVGHRAYWCFRIGIAFIV